MKKNYNSNFVLFACLFILGNYIALAQNINFTIDTAIDNGTSITESIDVGSDTFVFTALHPLNESLLDLGGGNFVFFTGGDPALNPFVLSITKNGNPVNFDLNSIDYDTIEAGTISLTNQDNNFISTPTAYPTGAGTLTITDPANATAITQINIIPNDSDDLNDFAFHNINVTILDTLSIDESILLEERISVLPNPSNGNITIKNSGIALNEVTVTDINGRIIESQNLNGIITDKNLDLSSTLSSGLYFVSISTENASTVKKLIIE